MSLLLTMLLAGCTPDPPATVADTDRQGEACPWDNDDTPDAASELAAEQQGYLCPVGDVDYYALIASKELLQVALSLDAPLSNVQLSYKLLDGDTLLGSPAADEAAEAGSPLSIVYRLPAGPLDLVVRDVGGDGEDLRHPYLLQVSSLAEPDAAEPNDDAASATPAPGQHTGYIASRGDSDWFSLSALAGQLLELRLALPEAGFDPTLRLLDPSGQERVRLEQSGSSASDQSWVTALDTSGLWQVVVEDDDLRDVDLAVPYSLSVILSDDPDPNEPNDTLAQATALPPQSCGGGGQLVSETAALAASGDVDWYAPQISGCDSGVLEVEVRFERPASLPAGLEPELRIVREHAGSSCQQDQDCQQLAVSCGDDWACATLGSSCLASGRCAGSGLCLPSGRCGANLAIQQSQDEPGVARVSVPLSLSQELWLGVADHGGDTTAPDHDYSLSVAVRDDPDLNEPNERYTGAPASSTAASRHQPFASELPVHDCTEGLDCCDASTWVSGALSYSYDQDWFKYEHPCPDADCMVRVVYELDGGPVDFFLQVFRGNALWYENLAGVNDSGLSAAASGALGGLAPSDTCFYAWSGHVGTPYYYYLSVRDTRYVNQSAPTGGVWDASADQGYRVCVERLSDSCDDPCVVYPDGCGAP